jgi:putative serine protease PepD
LKEVIPFSRIVIGVIAFASAACAFAAPSDFPGLLRKFQTGVVQVQAILDDSGRSSVGTGFEIDHKGTVITCHHVVAGAKLVYIRFADNSHVQCQLVDSDPGCDLAAIRPIQAPEQLSPLVIARRDTSPEPLEDLLLISDPLDLLQTPTLGKFAAIRDSKDVKDVRGAPLYNTNFHVFQLSISATHGSSGSPVLNSSGEVYRHFTSRSRRRSAKPEFLRRVRKNLPTGSESKQYAFCQ